MGWLSRVAVCLAFGAAVAPPAIAAEPAQSHGSPSEGTLVGGERLDGGPGLRVVGRSNWGMPELVGMLRRSAKRVADRHPGAVLTVGDLSRKGGGDIDGHRSHESGRDADVGFYLTQRGKPFLPPRFAVIAPDGAAERFAGVRFDDARNWALVEAWLTDPETRVLQVFVAAHLRARLLEHARRSGASAALQARAADLLQQPRRGLPHDNHFHVRIACPRGQLACVNFSSHSRPSPRAARHHHRSRHHRG